MPSRQHIIIVLAAVSLVGAGVGVVLGKRGAGARIQIGAQAATAAKTETPKTPKPAVVGQQVQSGAPAKTPDKRSESKPAEKSAEKSEASSAATAVVAEAPKPVKPETAPADASDLVFVSRKDLLRTRNAANEAAAIATLRAVASSQAQVQFSGAIDTDSDQQGEYAYFGELSGSVPCRAAPGERGLRLEPSILGAAFAQVSNSGNVLRSGYVFRIYLPGPTARDKRTPGIPESAGGGSTGGGPRPDADKSEILWSLYAWPIEAPATGARAFFINQEGDLLVLADSDGTYSGEERAPAFDAAFPAATPGDMAATPVPGAKCNDGHVWSALDLNEPDVEPPAELGPATQADLELNKRPDSERVVVSRTLMRQAHMSTNEAHAIQMLRALSSAQEQMRAAGVIDTDNDSKGEFAYFAELAGVAPCRAPPGSSANGSIPQSSARRSGRSRARATLCARGMCSASTCPDRRPAARSPGSPNPAGAVLRPRAPGPTTTTLKSCGACTPGRSMPGTPACTRSS